MRWFRAVTPLALMLLAATLLFSAAGRLLPPSPVLAYLGAHGTADALMLHDARADITHMLLAAPALRNPRWLPDGSGVLVDAGADWVVVDLQQGIRPLASDESAGTTTYPTPDWTAFASQRRGVLCLYDAQPLSADCQPLAGGMRLSLRSAVWSPDGAHFALALSASEPSSRLRQLGLIDHATGSLQLIAANPAPYMLLRWSPDSTRLAYAVDPDTIRVYDHTDATTTLWLRALETLDALAWSPGGDALVYATRGGSLYYLLPDADPRLLTDQLAANTKLAWSPDGTQLAVSTGTLTQHALYLYDLRSNRLRLLDAAVPANTVFAWQPQ